MTFFERYAAVAEQYNIPPAGQKAAELFNVTKAAISSWNSKGTTPKGDTVAVIADRLNVSTDYLLGRTEDPTDYTKHSGSSTMPIAFPGEKPDKGENILRLFEKLDGEDQIKAEGVLMGMLMANKYQMTEDASGSFLMAAHARTDVGATPEGMDHDMGVMKDPNF